MLKQFANFVLASLRGSTYRNVRLALRSLRPCGDKRVSAQPGLGG